MINDDHLKVILIIDRCRSLFFVFNCETVLGFSLDAILFESKKLLASKYRIILGIKTQDIYPFFIGTITVAIKSKQGIVVFAVVLCFDYVIINSTNPIIPCTGGVNWVISKL